MKLSSKAGFVQGQNLGPEDDPPNISALILKPVSDII